LQFNELGNPRETEMRLILLVAAVAMSAGAASAATPMATVALALKDHRFTPSVFAIPSGSRVQIVLTNQDQAYEEFDSFDLGVEESVRPGETVRFPIGPLQPGSYHFMGEDHPKTAQGVITATPRP
jgi:hypothetical protein